VCCDVAVPLPRLSVRNRVVLRWIELRATARFALAPIDWAGAARTFLAGTAALGACHPTVHSAVVMAERPDAPDEPPPGAGPSPL
jgi:hypothetical protein